MAIAIDDILTYAGFLKDHVSDMVDSLMKSLQVYVDDLFDPEDDNSNVVFSIPKQFYATCYTTFYLADFTADYSSYWGGYQPLLCCFEMILNNGELSAENFTVLGKQESSGTEKWNALSAQQQEDALSAAKAYFTNNFLSIVNDYPDKKVVVNSNDGAVYRFQPIGHNTTDIHMHGELRSGPFNSSYITVSLRSDTISENEVTGIISPNENTFGQPQYSTVNFETKRPFQCVINNETAAINYVATNDAVNNYVKSYTTDSGTFKMYYGDNYMIYVIPDTVYVSYNDIYNAATEAAGKINSDNPGQTPISVKTYDENKFGPEPPPEPDIDDDIEVEMDLNDATFGEGLSHYYVTTVDAPVLSDISEAMSSWNINNTGKDLYRNLLSCRITKVGPIPASPSTFVIYGEELQHNGSPITISKITGNPSMDLGEYEILPKFNDFRDYAPYTKIEMFIPFCGWVALPSHVMSSEEKPKIITGTLLCDIIAGTCKAVIKCNSTVVAEASGFTAVDVPFTGENVGMKMAGIASAITSYGNTASKTVGNIASGGMSGGAGAGASAAGGLVGLLGSYAQLHSAFNANYTEICGKTGDGCNVAGLNKVYIKIQRPKTGGYEAPDFVPEDYGHTTGFIAMQKKQISECEGLIVCANPDTSGIGGATDRERQMIKNLLESGIIVRQTEPEP